MYIAGGFFCSDPAAGNKLGLARVASIDILIIKDLNRGIANCCPNLTVWYCRLFGQPLLEHGISMFKFYIQVEMHAAMLARTAVILGCPAEEQS